MLEGFVIGKELSLHEFALLRCKLDKHEKGEKGDSLGFRHIRQARYIAWRIDEGWSTLVAVKDDRVQKDATNATETSTSGNESGVFNKCKRNHKNIEEPKPKRGSDAHGIENDEELLNHVKLMGNVIHKLGFDRAEKYSDLSKVYDLNYN